VSANTKRRKLGTIIQVCNAYGVLRNEVVTRFKRASKRVGEQPSQMLAGTMLLFPIQASENFRIADIGPLTG
jgi:hypothetical protein